MNQAALPSWSRASLGARDFDKLAELVYQACGIALTPPKRIMLEGRLRRRLQAHDFDDFQQYVELLKDPAGLAEELQSLIDAVTTNHTAFFREPAHFDYLIEEGLAELVATAEGRSLRAWSAACSTGEEPYTIAMVLAAHLPRLGGTGATTLATDISHKALQQAHRAIYRVEAIEAVPQTLRSQYFLRARNPEHELVQVTPELRRQVHFGHLNLMHSNFKLGPPLDILFCRNVLIYFDTATQQGVLTRLCQQLRPGGRLFLGHADATVAAAMPLRLIRANIYERL